MKNIATLATAAASHLRLPVRFRRAGLPLFMAAALAGNEARALDTLRTLAVLVDYSDAPGTLTPALADSLFNTPGYAKGIAINVRDYWLEVSRGKVLVHTDVIGTFRAPKTAAAYRALGWQDGVDMAGEAFAWAARTRPDYAWNSLSRDKDGRFIGLGIISSAKVPASGATHFLGDRFAAPNRVKAGSLVFCHGMNMFTINHEYGHMLFDWPDLYSITGGRGLGSWELMSGSDAAPGIPNAKLQAEQGWMQWLDLAGHATITLEENGTVAARFRNPKVPQEYFVVEARNDRRITTARPAFGRGLLIWHVDERVRGNGNYSVNGERMTAANHYYISLEQADGRHDLEKGANGGDAGDVYGPGKSFSDAGVPNSRWWDGSPSGLGIDNIQWLDDNRISFRVAAPGTAAILSRARGPRDAPPASLSAPLASLAAWYSLDGRRAAPAMPARALFLAR